MRPIEPATSVATREPTRDTDGMRTGMRPGIGARPRRRRATLAATAGAAALLGAAAWAQEAGEETGGLLATLGVEIGAEHRDERDGEDETGLTGRLTFGLQSITRSQSLTFSATGVYDLQDPEAESPFRPDARLAYRAQTRQTVFDLGLTYAEREVDSLFPGEVLDLGDGLTDVDFDADDLEADEGTRRDARLTLGLETGRAAPVGTRTTLAFRERRFDGTANPDLADLSARDLATTLFLRPREGLTFSVSALRAESEEDDPEQTDQRVTRVGLGVEWTLSRAWSVAATAGAAEIRTTRTDGAGRDTDKETGLDLGLTVTRALPRGPLTFVLSQEIDENGPRVETTVGRALTFRDGSSLDGRIGAVAFEDGEIRTLLALDYARPLPRGSLSLSLSRSGAVTDEGSDVVRTTGSASLRRDLTPVSALSLTGRLAAVDVVESADPEDEDALRAEIGLSYSRAVTRDWSLTASATHQAEFEDGERTDRANILSLGLSRSFAFRP